MEPDPNVPASEKPEPLPRLHLLKPDSVIANELRRIREQRAHHRAARVTVDEHFTKEVRACSLPGLVPHALHSVICVRSCVRP